MASRKKNVNSANKTLLIVTATEAEALYLSQMRKDCRFANMTVVNGDADSLQKLIAATSKAKNKGKFDVAYAFFGFDEVNTDISEVQAMEVEAEKKRINLCYFDPSFDLWIYLHLAQPKSFIKDKNVFINELKKGIDGYEMTPEYLLTKGLNLHMMLFPKHATADLNARAYNNTAYIAQGANATSVQHFNQSVTEICGEADMSHNTKVFK